VTGASPLAGDVRQTGKNAALNGKMSPGPVPAKRVVPGQMRWKSCHPASLPLALRKRGRNRNSKRKRQGRSNEKDTGYSTWEPRLPGATDRATVGGMSPE
jgi:hypothetical protein